MKSLRILSVLGLMLSFAASAANANLVLNGDFTEWVDRKPAAWSIVATPQKVTQDKPDGRAGAMKVEVVAADAQALGEIRQTVKVKPNQTYRFTGDIKSSKSTQAMFMLKPRANRKELERITLPWAGEEWQTITREFKTESADEVQILCRFVQKADSVGVSSYFSNVSLVRLDENGNVVEEAAPAAPKPVAAKALTKPVIAPAGTDQFVSPEGNGDRSGKDLANARPAASLQAAIDAAGPGNTVHIASGTYSNLSLTVKAGGASPESMVTIAGKDTGAGLPVFKSNFTKDNPAKSGSTLFTVQPGVGHLAIKDLVVQSHRQAVALKGTNTHIRIQNVDVTESRDAFTVDGDAIAGNDQSGSRDIVIRDCEMKFFTKRGVRIFGGVSNMQVINCSADAGGKEWATEPFAICFQVIGGKDGVVDSNITFTDCVASRAYHQPPEGQSYWNADGFCAEGATRDITWIRCSAFDCTDGGWDLKSQRPKLVDCIGIGNKRNFRIWLKPGDGGAVMENCLSAYSVNPGKNDHDVGFWFLAGGDLTMTRCTSWGDRVGMKVEGKDKPAVTNVTMDKCVLNPLEQGKAQSLYEGTELKNNGSLIGQGAPVAELEAPKPDWRGGDGSFNVKSNPDVGYRFVPGK